jgi:hypothetical protein
MEAVFARATYLLAVVAVIGLVTCGPALREDELQCEEAVAHLDECCPGFHPTVAQYCQFTYSTCGSDYPALRVDESECIRKTDCTHLREQTICERAAKANRSTLETDGSARPAVCP